MTIDIIELDQLLGVLIEDPRVPQEYQERLKRLKASIDPSERFNLKSIKGTSEAPSEEVIDPLLRDIDRLVQIQEADFQRRIGEKPLYVGLRDGEDRNVAWKRPSDTEGGNAD